MRFSTLVAFMAPLSALAAPTYINRRSSEYKFQDAAELGIQGEILTKGLDDTITTLDTIQDVADDFYSPSQNAVYEQAEYAQRFALYAKEAVIRIVEAIEAGYDADYYEYVDTSTALHVRSCQNK